jgi:hypothetical protein
MNVDDLNNKSYLDELYRKTGGDTEAQVSMHDIGAAIGLDKAEAGSIAEELMVQGLVELRTRAGGIGITAEGLENLGVSVSPPKSADTLLNFGEGPVAGDADRQMINLFADEIKIEISGQQIDFDLLEEIVLDLKTIEVQLLSPRPKIAVLRELFRSLHGTLEAAKCDDSAAKLAGVIS